MSVFAILSASSTLYGVGVTDSLLKTPNCIGGYSHSVLRTTENPEGLTINNLQ